MNRSMTRRGFCAWASSTAAASMMAPKVWSQDPIVSKPRATDGDSRFEPDWKERLTVTVGNSEGDFVGKDHRVIQGALDYVARFGGGTVQLLPGRFVCRNAVVLPSKTRLRGSGLDSVLTKIPSEAVALQEDSDWYDSEVTLEKSGSFQVGDGVVFQARNPHHGGATVIKRTLVARDGNRFKLDKGLRENLWVSGKPTCSSLFPILTAEYTADVWIEDLAIDGNKANNENFNGNYGGCIFLQDCQRFHISRVTTRNYNGDGISFQICHDVRVEECHSHDNSNLGLHPGSGSQRPVIRNNRLENNDLGLFWCWGVKFGLAEDNVIDGNRSYGISVGHNDTDNVMRRNQIRNSGRVGVLFRDESGGIDFWGNRNQLLDNEIVNSGDEKGIAIDVQGKTHDLVFLRNRVVEQRGKANRIAIRISKDASDIRMEENRIEGFAADVVDERIKKA